MQHPPSIDKNLRNFAAVVEQSGRPCEITLFVQGIVIVGNLSTWKLHYESLSQSVASMDSTQREIATQEVKPALTSTSQGDHEGGVPSDGSDDIFMQDVTAYLPNGKTASLKWWQGRLYSVDAFSLGHPA